MLYSLLISTLLLSLVMAFLVPLFVIKAFKMGYFFEKDEPIQLKPKKKKKKDPVESEIERRRKILEANIDNYDGTSTGQIEVK